MKTRFAPALLVLVALLCAPALQAQGVNVEKKRSRLVQVSDLNLRGAVRTEFKRFKRKGRFYGAFYANPAERVGGAFSNASSIETAEAHARAACEARSKNPAGCFLYARMMPKNHDPTAPGVTLSRKGNQEFREYTRLQAPDRYGAFALSDNGATGYSWAEQSQDLAERWALRRCEKAARKILRKTPDDMRPAVSDPSAQLCRIVHWSG